MPFTSSVFPVPRSPSSAMMSPGSRTCPRRRPSSRVSATDVVSTKVFIPGPFEQSLNLAIETVADIAADPDAGVDQDAPGDHARRWIQLGGDPAAFSRR